MNYSSLTIDEIMRIAEPKTDLEIALFNYIKDDMTTSDDLQKNLDDLQEELADSGVLEDRIDELRNGVRLAIDELKKRDGTEDAVSALEYLI